MTKKQVTTNRRLKNGVRVRIHERMSILLGVGIHLVPRLTASTASEKPISSLYSRDRLGNIFIILAVQLH